MSSKKALPSTDPEKLSYYLQETWGLFYETFFEKIFNKSRHSIFFGYILLCALWGITSFIAELLVSISASFAAVPLWYWPYYALVIGYPLFILHTQKRKFIRYVPLFMQSLSAQSDKEELLRQVDHMGDRKKQALFSLTFGIFCALVLALQRIVLFSSFLALFHIAFWAFVAAAITASGLWQAAFSLKLAIWYSERENLHIDFVNQSRTPGIKAFASMMSHFATLFIIGVLIWEIPFYVYADKIVLPSESAFWNISNVPFFLSSIIFALLLLFMLWYFIYPQLKLNALVNRHKYAVLEDIQARIRILYERSGENQEHVSSLGEFLALYQQIDSQKGVLPIQNVLAFATSFLASLILSLIGSIMEWL